MRPALEATRSILGNSGIVGIEVGVLRGENSLEILSQWGGIKKLYLVEDFREEDSFENAKERLKSYAGKFEWVIKSSVEGSKIFPDGFFDFVYVDAGHSYESVKEDIDVWFPKIRLGGVLAGHDYNIHWDSLKGVIRAVDEFSAFSGLKLGTETSGSSSDWWMQKI